MNVATESMRVLAWMGLPVVFGFAAWHVGFRARGGEELAGRVSRVLGRIAIFGSATPLMVLVMWVAPFAWKDALLPIVGIVVHVAGTIAGWGVARAQRQPVRTQAASLLAGGQSNVLTFGGITLVILLGTEADPGAEVALGRLAVYRVLEAPYYFLFAWPLAASLASQGGESGVSWRASFRRALRGPNIAPALGIAIGGVLNAIGLERPDSFDGLAALLVKVNVVLLGVTVGLGLRRASPARHFRSCVAMSAIKFLLMPGVGVGLAWALGFSAATLQVIAVAASMPVAFMAVVGAALYRLDEDLVASCWLVTTAALVVVVPLLAGIVDWLGSSALGP